jgi:hypothetical protein
MNDLIVVEKIAGWEKLKTLVLDSVSSPITKRVYNMALDEFLAWSRQAPRPDSPSVLPHALHDEGAELIHPSGLPPARRRNARR